jgi:iron-sulfur cluster repair protein YtfE (RIC family)
MTESYKLDMTMMFAIHGALRRDLTQVRDLTGRTEGWDLFAKLLHFHHAVEDDALWPVVRQSASSQVDDLALLDAMEHEHSTIDPVLDEIETAFAAGKAAPAECADLAIRLEQHLAHEEAEAIPLIDRKLSQEQWTNFGKTAVERLGPDMPRFLPWLLEGAEPERQAAVFKYIPEPVQQLYRNDWQPAFASKDWWAAG